MNVLACELEVIRIRAMQGEAEQALLEVEDRIREIRIWWQQHRAGKSVPEAPDPILLARALISSLDIAVRAHLFLKRWDACLDILTEIEELQQELGEGEHELANTRFNRYGSLLQLGRLDEAQRLLASCLDVFRRLGDLTHEARILGALANLWDKRGDHEQATGLFRQALTVQNRLPNLDARLISHSNLAGCLFSQGEVEEALDHLLAAIVYTLIMKHGQHMAQHLPNLALLLQSAEASANLYGLPQLVELLARPEFEPLQRTLAERDLALDKLQAQVNQVVEVARRMVEVAAAGISASPK